MGMGKFPSGSPPSGLPRRFGTKSTSTPCSSTGVHGLSTGVELPSPLMVDPTAELPSVEIPKVREREWSIYFT